MGSMSGLAQPTQMFTGNTYLIIVNMSSTAAAFIQPYK